MEQNAMLDAVERYIRGEMLPEELAFFEQLRKDDPTVDQLVVEHSIFLGELSRYGDQKAIRHNLNEIHQELVEAGEIKEIQPAKGVFLWKKYKRVIGVAASIAGITAVGISGLISYISPKVTNASVELLNRRLTHTEKELNNVRSKINQGGPASPEDTRFSSGGTGFLIDTKGYLVTNAHVIGNATQVVVENTKGQYTARIIHLDPIADIAFLKIDDSDYKAPVSLPYSISKGGTDLAEEIFTLGYPREDIVYGQGYMSARTGFEGDTLTYQIAVAANPGNSGGPVLNKNGEVIGILSGRESKAQGVVFAIRSKNIFRAIDDMKADSTLQKSDSTLVHTRFSTPSGIKNMDRPQQIRKIEDCIFIVKTNNH